MQRNASKTLSAPRDGSITYGTYFSFVIEPSLGADRVLLAFLCNAYEEEEVEGETRVVLHLHHALAPIKVAILPLQKQLNEKAEAIYTALSKKYSCEFDQSGSIGKRYRRQDEIGTPYCITVDFDTLEDDTVTIRERDTMSQIRIKVDELDAYFAKQFEYWYSITSKK